MVGVLPYWPAASFAACATCLSLRAAFRVCHDLFSVLGFGFSFFFDSRVGTAVVDVAKSPSFSELEETSSQEHRA
jgi:hypothetical protein